MKLGIFGTNGDLYQDRTFDNNYVTFDIKDGALIVYDINHNVILILPKDSWTSVEEFLD